MLVDVANPPPALGDGFRVDARIVVWAQPDVLSVPSSALVRIGERWGVFLVDAGRARLQRVELGHLGDGAAAELRGGVREGALVIVFPSDRVTPGVRVSPRG